MIAADFIFFFLKTRLTTDGCALFCERATSGILTTCHLEVDSDSGIELRGDGFAQNEPLEIAALI